MTNQTANLLILAIVIAFLVASYESLIRPAVEYCVSAAMVVWHSFLLAILVVFERALKVWQSVFGSQKADPNGSE